MRRVELHRAAYDLMILTVGSHHDPGTETGGIALGRDSGETIRITELGDPGPGAIHTSSRFTRDLYHAQDLAVKAWQRDRSQWVGEWHTHPSGELIPSSFDLSIYVRLLNDEALRWERLISLIVAPRSPVRVAAWVVTLNVARPVQMRIIDDVEGPA